MDDFAKLARDMLAPAATEIKNVMRDRRSGPPRDILELQVRLATVYAILDLADSIRST